jgi:hypothetical protein
MTERRRGGGGTMTLFDALVTVENIGSYARQHLPEDAVLREMLDELEQELIDAVYGTPDNEEDSR